ncbi:hypothetical protein L2E82_01673 [Cichorium intybus]|uniref:Uncharacterized protein n=1 Tax=Cichorium intybus TaxID=13427 RepID=A0ACB9H1Q0_CICIN|nr:hypothetical protein L2E82_01673 [Cichorium intybus]
MFVVQTLKVKEDVIVYLLILLILIERDDGDLASEISPVLITAFLNLCTVLRRVFRGFRLQRCDKSRGSFFFK